ncbi:unnamed protein product, partial [Musa banksii]
MAPVADRRYLYLAARCSWEQVFHEVEVIVKRYEIRRLLKAWLKPSWPEPQMGPSFWIIEPPPTADGIRFGSLSCSDGDCLIRSPRNAMANQTLLFFTEACICCWDVNSARQVFEEMPKPDGCAVFGFDVVYEFQRIFQY